MRNGNQSIPRSLTLTLAVLWAGVSGDVSTASGDAAPPLHVRVMDPLAAQLSCPCVAGYAQRDYPALAAFLQQRLGRPVRVSFGDTLAGEAATADEGPVHIVIGKHSVVRAAAKTAGIAAEPVAALTDLGGQTVQRGLFVVSADDPAESLADLVDYELHAGPAEHSEKHGIALEALQQAALPQPATIHEHASCSDAAAATLAAEQPAVAVISSYAQPLLEGCGAVPKASLKVVGSTPPVRFITVFVTGELDFPDRDAVRRALLDTGADRNLCRRLESAAGFVPLPETSPPAWNGWRGTHRTAIIPVLPDRLPESRPPLWSRPLARSGLGGLAASSRVVVYGDRDDEDKQDVFHCLDAATGVPRWSLAYDAPGELDYGNSPRATPLIDNGRAHLLGAFGTLHCVDLADGSVIWKRDLAADFGSTVDRRSAWGFCGSPLLADGRLIVAPGAAEASVVALDPATGREIWRAPGAAAGHGSFIVATCGGVRQVIGHDATSLGGWDLVTGRRLWTLKPAVGGDFNVPTPLLVGNGLLVATEMNGTRLHRFREDGTIDEEPVARTDELSPDMATPVAVGSRVFGVQERVLELSATNRLATVRQGPSGGLDTYAAVIASPTRLLVVGNGGLLMLYDIASGGCRLVSQRRVFDEAEATNESQPVYSHPAVVGTRMFIRGDHELVCLELSPTPDEALELADGPGRSGRPLATTR